MKLKIIFISFILSFFLSLSGIACAAGSLDIVINEIAWMGTESSYNDEWIELYNNTDLAINLDGWQLKAVDDTPKIDLAGIIPGKGFYLLERTDDTTVPNITADHIYTGALSNKGEYLKLFDAQNNLIDEVNCNDGWFSGDNSTKQTMERVNPQLSGNSSENWQASQNPNGTPKSQNSSGLPESGPLAAKKEDVGEEAETITYPTGIVFSEILPSPEGPDAENEWIEIFNKNDFEVDMSGWKISDIMGSTKTYTFSEGVKIKGFGFLAVRRPETKITLNNDSDGLKLIQPDGSIGDTVNYEKALLGQSYNFKDSQWMWSTTLTPESNNIITGPEFFETEPGPKVQQQQKYEASPSESKLSEETKKELAAIKEQLPEQGFGFFYVALIALSVAIVSGISVLTLKYKLKKN